MKRLIPLLSLLVALAAGTGCSTAETRAAHEAVENGALLLDVRTVEEYTSGHIDGAVNIPIDQLEGRMSELGPKDREVVVYCHSGGRSAYAKSLMERAGYDQVIDIGPMRAW